MTAPRRLRFGPVPRPWTPQMDADLRRMWAAGETFNAMNDVLKRNHTAILKRSKELDLPRRQKRRMGEADVLDPVPMSSWPKQRRCLCGALFDARNARHVACDGCDAGVGA